MCIWAFGLVGRACAGITEPRDLGWRLGRVINSDHAVVINAMTLSPMLCADVRREWSDVPWTDLQDVGHGGQARAAVAAPVRVRR